MLVILKPAAWSDNPRDCKFGGEMKWDKTRTLPSPAQDKLGASEADLEWGLRPSLALEMSTLN